MPNQILQPEALHVFSQLVYLDCVPAMYRNGRVTVGALADYYLNNPVGRVYLKARFEGVETEYELWREFLAGKAAACADWRITDIYDDNAPQQTGFYACTYLGPAGERVIAYRGSELLGNRRYKNDYVTDLALAYEVPTPQQGKARDYWARFGRPGYGGGLYLTGHSLGGNLAVYAAITAPQAIRGQIITCAAFNAPGFQKPFVRDNAPVVEEFGSRLMLIQNKYDLISSLLDNVNEPYVVASKFVPANLDNPSAEDILYPHSNFMYLVDGNGRFVPEGGRLKCFFCIAAHVLSDLFMLLPEKAREALAGLLLAALYAAPSPQERRRYALEALTKHIAREGLFRSRRRTGGEAIANAASLMGKSMALPALYRKALSGNSTFAAVAAALPVLVDIFIYLYDKHAAAR